MALMKVCSRCGKKHAYDSECECMAQARKDSYKDYKKRRQDKDRQKLYSSSAWIRLRDNIYRSCYGMCITCLMKDNEIVNASVVHHIEDTESNKDRWLDESNCVAVCQSCHMKIHKYMDKDSKSKKTMQDILFGLLDRFDEEYGESSEDEQ